MDFAAGSRSLGALGGRRSRRPRGRPGGVFALVILFAVLGLRSPGSALPLQPEGLFEWDERSAGTTALPFLRLPVGARTLSLGGHTATTDLDATAIRSNPALLASFREFQYSLSHTEILSEFRHEYAALAWPVKGGGRAFGLSANALIATPFENARDIEENPTSPAAQDLDLSAAYGYAVIPQLLDLGVRADFIRSAIDEAAAYGYALSGGALLHLAGGLRFGLLLENLSHGIRYNTPGSPLEPLPLKLSAEIGRTALRSPFSFAFGFTKGNDGSALYHGGLEARFYRLFFLRGGYEGSLRDRKLGGYGGATLGAGLRYGSFNLDYGVKSLGLLGEYHGISLSYSPREALRADPDLWFKKAKTSFRKGRFEKALKQVNRALADNPSHYQAHALKARILTELDRLSEKSFSLFYTANTQGRLAPLDTAGRSLGGLARRQSLLSEMKAAYPSALVLDAGGFLPEAKENRGPLSAASSYLLSAYADLPYHGIHRDRESRIHFCGEGRRAAERAAGDGNASGPGSFDPSRLPWMGPCPEKASEPFRFKTREGFEILVLTAGRPSGSGSDGGSGSGALSDSDFKAVAVFLLKQVREAGPAALRILLFDGTLAEAQAMGPVTADFDAVLLGRERRSLHQPEKSASGKTLFCSPGPFGMQVGHLSFTLGRRGERVSFRHRLLPLDRQVPPDRKMQEKLSPVVLDLDLFFTSFPPDERSPLFPYVAGGREIRLRDLEKDEDRLLFRPGTTGSGSAEEETLKEGSLKEGSPIRLPALSPGRNLLGFVGGSAAGDGNYRDGYHAGAGEALYLLSLPFGRPRLLGRPGASIPAWRFGPHSQRAYFLRREGDSCDLFVQGLQGRDAQNLSQGRFGRLLAFALSPREDRMAFIARTDAGIRLYLSGADLTLPLHLDRQKGGLDLKPGEFREEEGRDPACALAFSPDGKALAFIAPAAMGSSSSGSRAALHHLDLESGRNLPVTHEAEVASFAFLPDGKGLIYSSGAPRPSGASEGFGGREGPGWRGEGPALRDLTLFRFAEKTSRKLVVSAPGPAKDPAPPLLSLEHPRVKRFGGKDGILFEAREEGKSSVLWMDLETGETRPAAIRPDGAILQ